METVMPVQTATTLLLPKLCVALHVKPKTLHVSDSVFVFSVLKCRPISMVWARNKAVALRRYAKVRPGLQALDLRGWSHRCISVSCGIRMRTSHREYSGCESVRARSSPTAHTRCHDCIIHPSSGLRTHNAPYANGDAYFLVKKQY